MTGQETAILEHIIAELKSIRSGMPNGELKQIMDNQKEMKEDISELKYTLLNPEDGVIVKVNKNTDFRRRIESDSEKNFKHIQDLEDLKAWKSNVTKILWLIFGSIVTIVTKIFIGVDV